MRLTCSQPQGVKAATADSVSFELAPNRADAVSGGSCLESLLSRSIGRSRSGNTTLTATPDVGGKVSKSGGGFLPRLCDRSNPTGTARIGRGIRTCESSLFGHAHRSDRDRHPRLKQLSNRTKLRHRKCD